MSAVRWLWRELVRPRGRTVHRFYRVGERSEAGVALLVVITSLLFLTVLVTEIGYSATVRAELAVHQRDEAKAEALAWTGINVYRLVLGASKQLGNNPMLAGLTEQFGLPPLGDSLWQMIPFLNTGLMRMIFVSGGDLEAQDVAAGALTEEQVAESRESKGTRRNFLDFDGDFYAEVIDEDRRINVAKFGVIPDLATLQSNPYAVQLFGLMSGVNTCDAILSGQVADTDQREDNDQFFYERNLERWELIANLVDWSDADNTRLWQGGLEDNVYQRLEPPYLPKNAPFDTLDEIRLVDGWNDDEVWERYGKDLTTYGAGKINVNTADCPVIRGLLKSKLTVTSDAYVDDILRKLEEQKALYGGMYPSVDTFLSVLPEGGYDASLKSLISTQSTVFRVTSTGSVGQASVKLEAVIDYSSSVAGKIVYWRVE